MTDRVLVCVIVIVIAIAAPTRAGEAPAYGPASAKRT